SGTIVKGGLGAMLKIFGHRKWSSRHIAGVAGMLAGAVVGSVTASASEHNVQLLQPDGVMGPAVSLGSDRTLNSGNFVAYKTEGDSAKDEKSESVPRDITDPSNCGP